MQLPDITRIFAVRHLKVGVTCISKSSLKFYVTLDIHATSGYYTDIRRKAP